MLNDHSTDRTGAILADLSAGDERLRVLQGRDLPDGWLGKHWACQQMADAAGGELFLFTDADTRHGGQSIHRGAAALLAEDADLLTAFPHEETITWGEKLVVPVLPWCIFTFLPLALAYRTSSPAFSATIGQYMLFRASAYAQIGGHAAVRSDAVDDIALGRRIKAQGFRWRLADATHDVRCRMYQNADQVFEGFSKNLFAGFGYRLLPFLVTWVWLVIAFLLPVGVLLLRLVGAPVPALDTGLAAGRRCRRAGVVGPRIPALRGPSLSDPAVPGHTVVGVVHCPAFGAPGRKRTIDLEGQNPGQEPGAVVVERKNIAFFFHDGTHMDLHNRMAKLATECEHGIIHGGV